jgi:hypothetical protein
MLFFIGFAAGALMGTACLYFTLLRRPPPPTPQPPPPPALPALDAPKVRTRLTNRERTIVL